MKVVFHVGYGKTGSTSLQHFFQASKGWNYQKSEPLRSLFFNQKNKAHPYRNWKDAKWRREARRWWTQIVSQESELIVVSWEFLSSWNCEASHYPWPIGFYPWDSDIPIGQRHLRHGGHPALSFFSALYEVAPNSIEISAFAAVRRQDQLLASMYAQRARFNINSSEEDFDFEVRSLIQRRDPSLEYHNFVEPLAQILGTKNVRVVECSPDSIVSQFVSFAEVPSSDFYPAKLEVSNQRGSGDGTWTLHRPGIEPSQLRLTPSIKTLVMNYHRDSNQRTAQLLGRTLDEEAWF